MQVAGGRGQGDRPAQGQTYRYLGPWHRGRVAVRLSLAAVSMLGCGCSSEPGPSAAQGRGGEGAWSRIPESPRLMGRGRRPGREAGEHSGWAGWLKFGFGQFET